MWLALGRVSNLPTVASNLLAGAVLAGAAWTPTITLVVLVSLTLYYLGGMFLNDAFDAEIDARERTDRPIPRGDIGRLAVSLVGTAMLVAATLLLFSLSVTAGGAGLALTAAILAYDAWHKRVAWSPLLMGACRLLIYAIAALTLGTSLGAPLVWGAVGLACHVIGLTYAARQEAHDRLGATWPLGVLAVPVVIMLVTMLTDPAPSLLALGLWVAYLVWGGHCLIRLKRRAPGDVPRAVVGLIAAISLFDAVLMAAMNAPLLAMLGLAAFVATLWLQRLASGT